MNSNFKISLENLTWAKATMICMILLSASVLAYFGGNVAVSLNFEGRLYDVERALWVEVNSTASTLVKPCSYLIDTYISGSTYYLMWNGTNGKLDYYSTNASAVINYAFGNLTNGRTSKEVVLCKGNITIDSTLLPRNYTYLQVQGQISATYNPNFDLVRNFDFPNPSNDITIDGTDWSLYNVTFDGNWKTDGDGGTYNGNANGMHFAANSEVITLKNMRLNRINGDVLNFTGNCYVVTIDHVLCGYNAHGYGAYLPLVDSRISNCYFGGHGGDAFLAGTSNQYSDLYFGATNDGGPFTVKVCVKTINSQFSNMIVDTSSCSAAWYMANCKNNQVNGLRVTRPLATSLTAIQIDDSCINNVITGFFVGQKGELDDTAYGWDIGIGIGIWAAGECWNTFMNGHLTNCTTPYSEPNGDYEVLIGVQSPDAILVTTKTHTKATNFWNATNWVG